MASRWRGSLGSPQRHNLLGMLALVFAISLSMARGEPSPGTMRFAVQSGSCAGTERNSDTNMIIPTEGNCVGPMMARWAYEYSKDNGRNLEIVEVPFNDFEMIMKEDWNRTDPYYHGYFGNTPAFIADYAPSGDFADLTDFVQEKAKDMMWMDVMPHYREVINSYNGKIFSIMFDGDIHSLFYRGDLLEAKGWQVPVTIDELIEQASELNGTDMNNDGEPDYGFCLGWGANWGYDTSYYESAIAPFVQTKGSQQGFFFNPDTLEPLVDTEGFVRPILKLRELMTHGSNYNFMAANENWEPTMRNLFMSGRCAFTLDWGGLQRSIYKPNLPNIKYADNATTPYAKELIRTSFFPGTREVFDMETKEMKNCTRELCPYSVFHKGTFVNVAPLNAFCGFAVALNGHQPEQEQKEAFAFVAWWNHPDRSMEDVLNPHSWLEPFRISQFWPNSWIEAGMSAKQVKHYVNEMRQNLDFSNMASELRIKGGPQYQEEFVKWVDRLMGATFDGNTWGSRSFIPPGNFITVDEYKKGVRKAFDDITNSFENKMEHLDTYRLLLGKPSLSDCREGSFKDSNGVCSNCAPGKHANVTNAVECLPCQPGKHTGGGTGFDNCLDCPKGMYSELGDATCKYCPKGTYAEDVGTPVCTSCSPLTTQNIASYNRSACVCEEDTYMKDGDCKACPEGMKCPVGSDYDNFAIAKASDKLLGNEEFPYPILLESHWSSQEEPTSVFLCMTKFYCPGGAPDTCSEGREGISCAQCEPHKSAESDGTCQPCEQGNVAVFVLVIFLFVGALTLIYWVIDNKDHTKQSHAMMTCAMAMSVMVTSFQQLGIVGIMAVGWPEPIATFLSAIKLLNFDIEVLRLNCVAHVSPTNVFIMKLCVLAIGLVLLVLIHACFVLFRYQGDFKGRNFSLIGALGTLTMVFFISVTTTILKPMQCMENPNTLWTARGYRSVVCWRGGDHTTMIVFACIAMTVPIGYLVLCSLTVRAFPQHVRRGDVVFLRAYAFLFFRYRPEVYWFGLVHMFRSLILSLAPTIPDVVIQIVLMQLITVIHIVMTVYLQPWRLPVANVLDLGFSSGLVIVLTVGAFFVLEVNRSALGWFGIIMMMAMLAVAPLTLIYGVYTHVVQKYRKQFLFFLCHHKAGAGCFTRLLKLTLTASAKVTKQVFLDSDNLKDLDLLFDYVGSHSDYFLMIANKELLTRPWCMGEIVTGHCHGTKSMMVLMKDFSYPTEEFMENYHVNVDISKLAERGISLGMIQGALKWLSSLPNAAFPSSVSENSLRTLVGWLVTSDDKRVSTELAFEADPINPTGQNAILVDHSNSEAQAAALVLKAFLTKRLSHTPDQIPFVVADGMGAPSFTVISFIMCTQGALSAPNFLKVIMSAAKLNTKYLPILADESFRFPTEDFVTESQAVVQKVTQKPQALLTLILSIFKAIAVVFQPQHYSSTEEILGVKSLQIVDLMILDKMKRLEIEDGVDVLEDSKGKANFSDDTLKVVSDINPDERKADTILPGKEGTTATDNRRVYLL